MSKAGFLKYALMSFNYLTVLIGIILLLFLISCSKKPSAYHEQFLAFGTIIDVKIFGVDDRAARQAITLIEQDFNLLHNSWHAWKPGSLSRINGLIPLEDSFTIGPTTVPVIRQAIDLSQRTDGLFNPAIGELIKLWGFASDEAPTGPPPEASQIQAILDAKPSMQDITLQGIRLSVRNPSVRLDFGGFAKGLGVDYAIEHLKDLGIHNAVVNAGGDLRAIGRHGERAWRVGIRNPRGSGILASVDVQGDECVFTSGDYERFFEYQGKRYSHIIDPRSGYPAQHVSSVTVFDDSAAVADAAATALFIAGPDHWFEIARKLDLNGVMLVEKNGTVHMTPGLKSRIYFEDPKPIIHYSEKLIREKPIREQHAD